MRVDVLVTRGRKSYLFDPVTPRAKEWVEDNLGWYQEFGGAVMVDRIDIEGLVADARRDGLVVEH